MHWKSVLRFILIVVMLFSLVGCWNYREVDEVLTVAGIAIDKGEDNKIVLTAEIIDLSGGEDTMHTSSELITQSGHTMFEIVRRMITESGKKLYWAHAKSIIMSEEISRSGAAKVIDWYARDTETRSDIHILVAGGTSARAILESKKESDPPLSYKIVDVLKNEVSISTSPVTEIWEFVDTINTPGISSILPMIYINDNNGKKKAAVSGLAIFDMDRMLGKMDHNKAKYVLFLRNKIKGGILSLGGYNDPPGITLEIFSNKTEIEPVLMNGNIEVLVKTHTVTAVDEVQSEADFYTDKGRSEIERMAEEMLEHEMLNVIEIAQKQYQQDLFGFGREIHKKYPKQWRKLKTQWDENFSQLKVTVQSKVVIKNTASTIRPIIIEEED